MTKRRSGLQKSVAKVFKDAVVPEEVKPEYDQMKIETKAIPQPEVSVEAPAHPESTSVTSPRIPNKGSMPIYLKESSSRRKKSWWSALTSRS